MNIQQSKNTMSGHGCDICGGLGYTVRRTESGELVSRTCKCEIIRRNRLRMERSGLLGLLDSCTFESFQTQEYWQQAAKQAAEKYLTDWKGKWFFIGGSPGTGKTHLCTAICTKLMDGGIPVRYVQWRGDIPAIKAKTSDAEAYAEAMQPLKTVRALYIDDFLKGTVTEGDRNIAFDLLNARYIKPSLLTIISSEWTISRVLDWDEAIGSRIAERSKGCVLNITEKKNYRLK